MSVTMSVEEAQKKLPEILGRLAPGEEIVLTQDEQPVARLIAERLSAGQRPGPGLCRGMLTVVADDEEHLKDFQEYLP